MRVFPAPKTFWETVFSKGPDSSEDRAEVVVARNPWETFAPAIRLARRLGLVDPRPQDVLTTPELAPAP